MKNHENRTRAARRAFMLGAEIKLCAARLTVASLAGTETYRVENCSSPAVGCRRRRDGRFTGMDPSEPPGGKVGRANFLKRLQRVPPQSEGNQADQRSIFAGALHHGCAGGGGYGRLSRLGRQ